MSLTREDLQAISDLIDERLDKKLDEQFKPLNDRLNMVDEKVKLMNDRLEILEIKQDITHKKLDDLTLDVKISERSIKKDIKLLKDAQETLITVLEHQNILPVAK